MLIEVGFAKDYASDLNKVIDGVRRRGCSGFQMPTITTEATSTLTCAAKAMQEYVSAKTIDGH